MLDCYGESRLFLPACLGWSRVHSSSNSTCQVVSNVTRCGSTLGYPPAVRSASFSPASGHFVAAFAKSNRPLYVLRMLRALLRRWQRYICSPAPDNAPYFTLLMVNKAAAPGVRSSNFEEVHFDNSCMGERQLRLIGAVQAYVTNTAHSARLYKHYDQPRMHERQL
jgi:hypothetical protein